MPFRRMTWRDQLHHTSISGLVLHHNIANSLDLGGRSGACRASCRNICGRFRCCSVKITHYHQPSWCESLWLSLEDKATQLRTFLDALKASQTDIYGLESRASSQSSILKASAPPGRDPRTGKAEEPRKLATRHARTSTPLGLVANRVQAARTNFTSDNMAA